MKSIAQLFSVILISLVAHAANAQQDLEDLTDQSLELQGSLTRSQKQFIYTFDLTAPRVVDILLSGLSSNANLRLVDSSSTTLASSSNSGVASESIQQSLDMGDYSILVEKPGVKRLSYTLTVSAQGGDPGGDFTPQDDVVSGNLNIQDPEFDPMTFNVAWRTTNDGRLFIAPVNPSTGDILLDQRVEVDRGLALPSDVVNGPEWSLSRAGARVVYTKLIDNGRRSQVAQARFISGWAGSLVPGSEDGSRPFGNTDPTDYIPLVAYTLGTRAQGITGNAWQMLDGHVGGVIPESLDIKGGRWVPGGRSIVCSKPDQQGFHQISKYNITTGAWTTLTSGPEHKRTPIALRAPDLNDIVITVGQTGDLGASDLNFKWIGVYRKVGGVWTRIKQIFSPSAELPVVDSPEPFAFGGKSYVSFLAVKDLPKGVQRKQGSAVFIASLDPNDDFVRKVSAPSESMVRSDPEPFATGQAAFIYYTELDAGVQKIHRCATGL